MIFDYAFSRKMGDVHLLMVLLRKFWEDVYFYRGFKEKIRGVSKKVLKQKAHIWGHKGYILGGNKGQIKMLCPVKK